MREMTLRWEKARRGSDLGGVSRTPRFFEGGPALGEGSEKRHFRDVLASMHRNNGRGSLKAKISLLVKTL